jgi:hypothetical protein
VLRFISDVLPRNSDFLKNIWYSRTSQTLGFLKEGMTWLKCSRDFIARTDLLFGMGRSF